MLILIWGLGKIRRNMHILIFSFKAVFWDVQLNQAFQIHSFLFTRLFHSLCHCDFEEQLTHHCAFSVNAEDSAAEWLHEREVWTDYWDWGSQRQRKEKPLQGHLAMYVTPYWALNWKAFCFLIIVLDLPKYYIIELFGKGCCFKLA